MRGMHLVKVELETDAYKCDGCSHAEAVPRGTYALLRAPQSWLVVEYNGKAYTFHKPGCLEGWARRLRQAQTLDRMNERRVAQGMQPLVSTVLTSPVANEESESGTSDEATAAEPEPAH